MGRTNKLKRNPSKWPGDIRCKKFIDLSPIIILRLIDNLNEIHCTNDITYCLSECTPNSYGIDCLENCGNCSTGGNCHHVNGTCLHGCNEGVYGDKCKTGEFVRLYNHNIDKCIYYSYKCMPF